MSGRALSTLKRPYQGQSDKRVDLVFPKAFNSQWGESYPAKRPFYADIAIRARRNRSVRLPFLRKRGVMPHPISNLYKRPVTTEAVIGIVNSWSLSG